MRSAQQPKVSILVPCYNVEKYLPQCLDSIVNQTLKDIEIICINDGSTDNTLNIIKDYAKKDSRIVVIDKLNEGYGKSMNRGLDTATGKYVGIVESDDWVEKDAFNTLYKAAKSNNADLVKAEFIFFDDATGKETPSWDIGIANKLKERVFCPTELNPEIIWTGHPSIWTCLYNNKMLKKYKIRFAETPGAAFQDMGFKPKTFIVAKRFYYLQKVVLHYRKHANNSDKNNSKIFAICDAHDDTDNWLRTNRPDLIKLMPIMTRCRFANYVWNLRRLYGKPKKEFRKRFTKEFREYYKNGLLENMYFDTKSWLKLKIIMNPRNPIYGWARTIIALISPIYKNRICDGHKVHSILNTIKIRRQKLKG